MHTGNRIGIDIGGSHITAAIIDVEDPQSKPASIFRKEIDTKGAGKEIIESISACILAITANHQPVAAVGIAFPGPFDYKKGVSRIAELGGKFQHIFGLHVAQALKDGCRLYDTDFYFENDAHCFAAGAANLYNISNKRSLFLTLGTGFGSSFMEDGVVLAHHPSIPASGALYGEKFRDSIADDYFSTRWILSQYKAVSNTEAQSVKDIAESASAAAVSVFKSFGSNLGKFLFPWLQQFACEVLVIGGNIAKAETLFHAALISELQLLEHLPEIIYGEDTEACILKGAALQTLTKETEPEQKRKTTQALLPLCSLTPSEGYAVFPSYHSRHIVHKGFEELADIISKEQYVVIDGYGGVLWENFRKQLHHCFVKKNKKIFWYDIASCLKPAEAITDMISQSLNGDDPVFGKKYTGTMSDFFDGEKLSRIIPAAGTADTCIIYGTGAALTKIKAKLIYIDVPKNEVQYRMRAGSICNLGTEEQTAASQMYKRFYFVDWPVLNQHKEQLLSAIDFIIDEQRIDEITWMQGNDFRKTLVEMTTKPFRARPWFEAGVWGGNWMKKHITGLNNNEINYAWSFELITPENGIVIEGNSFLMEVSFDFLMYAGNQNILGNAADRFGKEFPIRFDFLDTYDGGNLSIQCHPRPDYIRENFGESFTQDETYYILDCEPDATVYLGFQEDINREAFKNALEEAQQKSIGLAVEKYVQKHPAQKHDLFLIPNGTIHASGKNNMVLEISSTPYIFTFKMYDWLRLDLNGHARPINIAHAFNNLYFERKGNIVQKELISVPQLLEEWPGGRKLKLPTHPVHFYEVDRYEFKGSVWINTHEQCHICMLVEGVSIEVVSDGKSQIFKYAETFVIPAAVKNYQFNYEGTGAAFVVVAYVKEAACAVY
jgi:predicted NBD/HSP70 family sugar kinase/mannose-6-phosphate isomerase class I